MEENTEIIPEEQEIIRNPDGTFVKGVSGNPKGRTAGTRDFATDFDEVVKDIAKENNITVSDVRKVLLKQAYKQAKDGNYSFYKDIHDRVYGQAKNTTDITTGGEKLPISINIINPNGNNIQSN
jgi:hypothetical protein